MYASNAADTRSNLQPDLQSKHYTRVYLLAKSERHKDTTLNKTENSRHYSSTRCSNT